ncbi:hypothetical protein ACFSYH_14830, partial [Populibacterium corticicola]
MRNSTSSRTNGIVPPPHGAERRQRFLRKTAATSTVALLAGAATVLPANAEDEAAPVEEPAAVNYIPSAALHTADRVTELALSADQGTLYTYSEQDKRLAAYSLDDCEYSAMTALDLDCAQDWSAALPSGAQGWYVDNSPADAEVPGDEQIFVVSQDGTDGALTRYSGSTGKTVGAAITIADHDVHALTYAPVNQFAYVLATDGVVLVDVQDGKVTDVIAPRVDGDAKYRPGQQAIMYNPFSTGTTAKPTADGLVYAAYQEYLTTVDVATNTRVETTRRLTTSATLSFTGESDPVAASPSKFSSGYFSDTDFRAFGLSSKKLHGREMNAVYLYQPLSGGSMSTRGIAPVAEDPQGLAQSNLEKLAFVSTGSDNSVSVIDASTLSTAAHTPVDHVIDLDAAGITRQGAVDVARLAVAEDEAGTTVFVANPASRQITVLERLNTLDAATPKITGRAQVDATLTVDAGTWDEGTELAYQWFANGAAIEDATDTSYTISSNDIGKKITVRVIGFQEGYANASAESQPTAAVQAGELVAAVPIITGAARVDSTLTVVPGVWSPGVSLSYQWFVGGQRVDGATGSTFTARASDVGKSVTVQ